MKNNTASKKTLKDVAAFLRVEQIMLDKGRTTTMREFISEQNIDKSFCINIYIKNSKINTGGK